MVRCGSSGFVGVLQGSLGFFGGSASQFRVLLGPGLRRCQGLRLRVQHPQNSSLGCTLGG